MAEALTLQLDAPIHKVAILGDEPIDMNSVDPSQEIGRQVAQKTALLERRAKQLEQEFAMRNAQLEQAAMALRAAGEELANKEQQMIEEMRSEVVHLAMDIARKVLHQEIESKGYQIDPIVADALSHLPQRTEITVRLHPDDFERCSLSKSGSIDDEKVRFVADPDVSPAGCLVTSVEGCVESSPETSLGQIDTVLREDA